MVFATLETAIETKKGEGSMVAATGRIKCRNGVKGGNQKSCGKKIESTVRICRKWKQLPQSPPQSDAAA